MKTFRFIGMAIFAVLMCGNFITCSNEDMIPEEQDKYITLGFNCVGEYLDIIDSPLSRAKKGDDVYYFRVYSINEEIASDGGIKRSYTPYANGVFATSLNDITIKLIKGTGYKFEVGIIVGGVKYDEETNNKFEYSTKLNIMNWMDSGYCPHLGTYYGELDQYIPTENGSVSIDTKLVSYGAEYIAEGLTEGSLNIKVSEGNTGHSVILTPEIPNSYKIYSFANVYQAWKGIETYEGKYEEYTSKATLEINWTKENEDVTPLGTFEVIFKRNVKTTIRIKVEDLASVSNGIIVKREQTSLIDDDNEYVIEGGEIIEVPISSES